MASNWLLRPGSDAALDAGCVCPVLDNNHGKGASFILPDETGRDDGAVMYWIDATCPLHREPGNDSPG